MTHRNSSVVKLFEFLCTFRFVGNSENFSIINMGNVLRSTMLLKTPREIILLREPVQEMVSAA